MKKNQRNQKKTTGQKAVQRKKRQELKAREKDARVRVIGPRMVKRLEYRDVFGECPNAEFSDLLGNIPTFAAINYVATEMNRIMYKQTNQAEIKEQSKEMISVLNGRERQRFFTFRDLPDAYVIFTNEGCFRFYYAMKEYHLMLDGNYRLTKEDKKQIYKALLYCNQIISKEQEQNVEVNEENIVEMSILVDMPCVEFKFYKYFISQLEKSLQFFKYYENPSDDVKDKNKKYYRGYLEQFYQDMHVADWREYLKPILMIVINTIYHGAHVKINPNGLDAYLETMLIQPEDIKDMDYKAAFHYMRGHFIWKATTDWNTPGRGADNTYVILNSNLLVDRIFQGLLFSFLKSINKYNEIHDLPTISLPDYKTSIGEDFTEHHLLYTIMGRAFANERYDAIAGREMKMDGSSDYYVKVGDKLLIFELKDSLIADDKKFSHDIEKIKAVLLERLCNEGSKEEKDNHRKGLYQLMNTITAIDEHKYDGKGINVNEIKTIYPILVVTDTAFCANGVNAFIAKYYEHTVRKKFQFQHDFAVCNPIIIHIDTLITSARYISDGTWHFEEMLDRYLGYCSIHAFAATSPFDTFVTDHYARNTPIRKDDALYVFGDDLKMLLQ